MQHIFKRYEKKYLVTQGQAQTLRNMVLQHMEPDEYGEYFVRSLYYDTGNWDVIRASIEKPLYKEKFRLRCYGIPNDDETMFAELKKKYKGIAYKRRISFPSKALDEKTVHDILSCDSSQISRELDFYLKANMVDAKMFIFYTRTAFTATKDTGLRITFDRDIYYKVDNFSTLNQMEGQPILPKDTVLMEIKTIGAIPLWLTRTLGENNIFQVSFSKYGKCYVHHLSKNPTFDMGEAANSKDCPLIQHEKAVKKCA